MKEKINIATAVESIPEKYQPIFGHPLLSDGSSRGCEDRLAVIRHCTGRLQEKLKRPLRILDLGCAQGYFSMSLASDGHTVHGVDFLDLNVAVCNALAREYPQCNVSFQHGTIQEVIAELAPGSYDLVLGLSVFHHLIHEQGLETCIELCRRLSEMIAAGIFELAVREEPLYWAKIGRAHV